MLSKICVLPMQKEQRASSGSALLRELLSTYVTSVSVSVVVPVQSTPTCSKKVRSHLIGDSI